MTDNNAQPGAEEVPEEFREWTRERAKKAIGIEFLADIAMRDDPASIQDSTGYLFFQMGSYAAYGHLAPILQARELSIIQRDHEWKKVYDQWQECVKEVEGLKKLLGDPTKTHDTFVIAFDGRKIIFFQSFDYANQKEKAQAALAYAETLGGWYISHAGRWQLVGDSEEPFSFDMKIPK